MLQKQNLFHLKLKTNNWTLISSSNYAEKECIPQPKLGIWVFWLMINLTGILILIEESERKLNLIQIKILCK